MFLGISAYFHDSSVALIDSNGDLIDFKKEEYLSRVKGDKSFPRLALTEIIKNHNLSDKNINKICFFYAFNIRLSVHDHEAKKAINNKYRVNYIISKLLVLLKL